MDIISEALTGIVYGFIFVILLMLPGKSGECLLDKVEPLIDKLYDWCEKHLPW